ncbi:hypothetical protein ACT7DN_26945 [Bacillus paranthracis]
MSNYGRFKRIGKKKIWFLLPILKKKSGYLEIKVKYKGVYKNYIIAQLVVRISLALQNKESQSDIRTG